MNDIRPPKRLSYRIISSSDESSLDSIISMRTANRIPRKALAKSNILRSILNTYKSKTSSGFYDFEHISRSLNILNELITKTIPNCSSILKEEKSLLINKCRFIKLNFQYINDQCIFFSKEMMAKGALVWKVVKLKDIKMLKLRQDKEVHIIVKVEWEKSYDGKKWPDSWEYLKNIDCPELLYQYVQMHPNCPLNDLKILRNRSSVNLLAEKSFNNIAVHENLEIKDLK